MAEGDNRPPAYYYSASAASETTCPADHLQQQQQQHVFPSPMPSPTQGQAPAAPTASLHPSYAHQSGLQPPVRGGTPAEITPVQMQADLPAAATSSSRPGAAQGLGGNGQAAPPLPAALPCAGEGATGLPSVAAQQDWGGRMHAAAQAGGIEHGAGSLNPAATPGALGMGNLPPAAAHLSSGHPTQAQLSGSSMQTQPLGPQAPELRAPLAPSGSGVAGSGSFGVAEAFPAGAVKRPGPDLPCEEPARKVARADAEPTACQIDPGAAELHHASEVGGVASSLPGHTAPMHPMGTAGGSQVPVHQGVGVAAANSGEPHPVPSSAHPAPGRLHTRDLPGQGHEGQDTGAHVRPVPSSASGPGPCASLTPEEEAIWVAAAAAEAENEQLDQQAGERPDTLQAAAAPAELGAAGANEWGSIAKTEVARILVVVCGSSQGQALSFRSGCGALSDLLALSGEAYKAVVEVQVEWNPTLTALRDAVAQLHPTLVYFVCPAVDTGEGSSGGGGRSSLSLGALRLGGGSVEAGGAATEEEIAECICSCGSTCQGVYVDAKGGMRLAEVLRKRGVANVVCWVYRQEEVPVEMAADGSVASAFSRAFFGALMATGGVRVPEAFAAAAKAVPAYSPLETQGELGPAMHSDTSAALADHLAIVPPSSGAMDLAAGIDAVLPGWKHVRMVAPRAQMKLVLAGSPESERLDARNLADLARALRSLLAADVRGCEPLPHGGRVSSSHIRDGRQYEVVTGAGAMFDVQLGAPEEVARQPWAVQHALAVSLATDAMQLQFHLTSLAAGKVTLRHEASKLELELPGTQVLVTTSVWAASVLNQYATQLAMPGRALLRLGILQVGSQPVSAVSEMDLDHLKAVVEVAPLGHIAPPAPVVEPAEYGSTRPPLETCSPEEFLADLHLFYKAVLRCRLAQLPILNGSPLDLFNLYVEVCKSGGHECTINWKGQVFPKMTNFAKDHKQTAVGNALIKHYRALLLTYELHHPGDVASGRCILCSRGEEPGLDDWLNCCKCEEWVHYPCDRRKGLAPFREYHKDGGPEYTCPRCCC